MPEPIKLQHITLQQGDEEGGNAILLHPELFYRLVFNIKDAIAKFEDCRLNHHDGRMTPVTPIIRALNETSIRMAEMRDEYPEP
jgi:hypothetical protein